MAQKKGRSFSTQHASTMEWPSGLSRTPIRVHWHNRLSSLPTGLSLQQLAAQLSEPYASVAFWANKLGYSFIRLKRGRKTTVEWGKVDWSQRNCDLARQLGVTGERVRQMRLVSKPG